MRKNTLHVKEMVSLSRFVERQTEVFDDMPALLAAAQEHLGRKLTPPNIRTACEAADVDLSSLIKQAKPRVVIREAVEELERRVESLERRVASLEETLRQVTD